MEQSAIKTGYILLFQRKGQNQVICCLEIHVCNKTIEKSKEMAITKVRIIVTSKGERVVFRKVTVLKCSVSWRELNYMESLFTITHFTEVTLLPAFLAIFHNQSTKAN